MKSRGRLKRAPIRNVGIAADGDARDGLRFGAFCIGLGWGGLVG